MASREEDEKACRLCRGGEDDGPLVLSCACRGSAKWIHKACLEEWQRTGSREDTADRCGQCKDEYDELLSAMPDEDLLSGLGFHSIVLWTWPAGCEVHQTGGNRVETGPAQAQVSVTTRAG